MTWGAQGSRIERAPVSDFEATAPQCLATLNLDCLRDIRLYRGRLGITIGLNEFC